ncbi:MAG: heterodisulfide reductase-related iron-sulfur binding cluster [Acidobacteriota bacterium]
MSGHDVVRLVVAAYLLGALAVFARLLRHKIRFVRAGRPECRSDRIVSRVRIFFSEVLGQTKVRKRLTAGWAHALVFWGFLAFSVSTLDLIVRLAVGGDGFLTGGLAVLRHLVDAFAAAILLGIVILAYRRYVIRPSYLTYHSRESAVVLALIAVIALTHVMERALPGLPGTYSGYLHLMVAFSFLAYVPTSKHFHILSAPVNAVTQQLGDHQKMDYMDLEAVPDERKGEAYGFNALEHFTWKDRLDLVTCIECGRCQEACPAYATGKLLNPKEFIVDLKYHAMGKVPPGRQAGLARQAWQEAGRPGGDGPVEKQPLIDHVISDRILWECTACMGCVAACPVNIDHLSMLLNMRRYKVLDEGRIGQEIQKVFLNVEQAGDPWGYGPQRKSETVGKLDGARIAAPGERFEVLFWVGCWGLYDDRSLRTTRAILKVLAHYGVDYRIIGEEEVCCGENYRRMGNELLFQTGARTNLGLFSRHEFKTLIVANPHCYQMFRKDYVDFLPEEWNGRLPFEVRSAEDFVRGLVRRQGLPGGRDIGAVTYHDSCFYGRYNGQYDAQRDLVRKSGGRLVEMPRSRENSFCCGAGGGNMWLEEMEPRVSWNRAAEVMQTGARTLAVSCPFCVSMLEDGLKAQKGYDARPVEVRHVMEIVADALPDPAGETPPHRP